MTRTRRIATASALALVGVAATGGVALAGDYSPPGHSDDHHGDHHGHDWGHGWWGHDHGDHHGHDRGHQGVHGHGVHGHGVQGHGVHGHGGHAGKHY
jgi:hypothetical protein